MIGDKLLSIASQEKGVASELATEILSAADARGGAGGEECMVAQSWVAYSVQIKRKEKPGCLCDVVDQAPMISCRFGRLSGQRNREPRANDDGVAQERAMLSHSS